LIADIQTEVDNGETTLTDSATELTTAYVALETFTQDPTEILLDLSEDVETIFIDTNYDYDGVSDYLGSDWLSTYISSMEDIVDADTVNSVCADNFVYDILVDEYSWTGFLANCWEFYLGSTPDCDCLEGSGLYNNTEKESIVASLDCLYDDADDLTVEESLLNCYDEPVQVDEAASIETAFQDLTNLSEVLTEDNYGVDLDTDLLSSNISTNFQDIVEALEGLSDVDIDEDGTDEEWLSSVSDYITSFETLVDAMDMDGSYTTQAEDISDLLDTSFSSMTTTLEEGDGDSSSSDTNSWLGVVIGVLVVIIMVAGTCILVMRRNKKIANVAMIENEELGGDFLPTDVAKPDIQQPSTTGGGPVM